MTKKRKPRGKQYFTKVHEEKIIDYNNTDCLKTRTEIYKEYIQPVFSEMVDKIVLTFKFTNLHNIDLLRSECKTWLMTIIEKFNPDKNFKAFSYFSVITKNWFIHEVKKRKKRLEREVPYRDLNTVISEKELTVENPFYKQMEKYEFWLNLVKEIKSWKDSDLKPNDELVLNSILEIFEKKEKLEIFNKKAIYLYLRELTGLTTKQIATSLKKFKVYYAVFKEDWDDGYI